MRRILKIYKAAYADLPREVWILSLVVFINRSGSIVLFFMTLYLTRELNFSVSTAGKIISIYGIGALMGTYLGGWLSDIIGSKRVQILSLIFAGIGFVYLGTIQTLAHMAIVVFLLAAVGEAFRPANATALSYVCPPPLRPRAFALNRMSINLGVTIGPALGGLLATLNYGYLFWMDGLTCIIAGFLLWIFFRPKLSPKFVSEAEGVLSEKNPWRDKIFLFILSLILLCSLIFIQLFNTWPIYLRAFYGLIENRIGLLIMVNALMIVLFEMPIIHKLEKLEHIGLIAIGALLLGTGFALLPMGNTFIFAIFTVIIWSIGEILVFPLLIGFISNRATEKNRGKYMGMYNFSIALAFVIGPIFGTAIYDMIGPHILWMICGLMGIVIYLGFKGVRILLKREIISH